MHFLENLFDPDRNSKNKKNSSQILTTSNYSQNIIVLSISSKNNYIVCKTSSNISFCLPLKTFVGCSHGKVFAGFDSLRDWVGSDPIAFSVV